MELRSITIKTNDRTSQPKRLDKRQLKCVLATDYVKKVGSKRKNRKTGTPTNELNKKNSSKTSNAASIICTSKTEIFQTEQSDSPDTPDNVEELSLVPSTRTQKMSRKLARQRQLEKMKKTEQSDERRMRYLKRQLINSGEFEGHNETDGEPGNKKQVHVQWCNDVTFHSYTPENTPP